MFPFLKRIIEKIVPSPLLKALIPAYHKLFAASAMWWYGMPAKKLFIIGVTGTKGKSSTVEMVNAILEEAGYRTAVISTIRFKIDTESRPNLFKMTMPGRGFIQGLLREAVEKNCTHAVVEITSEGAWQFRHAGLFLNALMFTNIAKEHIESHGSFENYKKAKLAIGNALVSSPKRPRIIVAQSDDELGKEFLALPVEQSVPFGIADAEPYALSEQKVSMTAFGATFDIHFPGAFTVLNALGAATLAHAMSIDVKIIAHALGSMKKIAGRVERIERGQPFTVIVDYAHTPDSLKALYGAFQPVRQTSGLRLRDSDSRRSISKRKLICVLGNTGGGRDQWKRPEMGAIADRWCDEVILTNEDPYDEDPNRIIYDMAVGMKRKPRIVMDRREAIREALRIAATLQQAQGSQDQNDIVVLVSGKGTDPFIMGPKGSKMPWSDAAVVTEELKKLGHEA